MPYGAIHIFPLQERDGDNRAAVRVAYDMYSERWVTHYLGKGYTERSEGWSGHYTRSVADALREAADRIAHHERG